MTGIDDQQFCLRWNNFQSYITSQFEALRDDEDFVDVTLACEGQRLGAHKVVLSACSPFFKELFKSNPCRHPIVFMRDVEVRHVVALLEFMYAGEVNVAQKNLAGFLKTAESLQIRGLTDATKNKKTTSDVKGPTEAQPTSSQTPSSPTPEPRATQTSSTTLKTRLSPSRTVTSSQEKSPASPVEPPRKKHCKADPIDSVEASLIGTTTVVKADIDTSDTNSNIAKSDLAQINPFAIETKKGLHSEIDISTDLIEPKLELPDYSEDDELTNQDTANFMDTDQQNAFANLAGGMQIIPGTSGMGDISQESDQGAAATMLVDAMMLSRGKTRASRRRFRSTASAAAASGAAARDWLHLPLALDMADAVAAPPSGHGGRIVGWRGRDGQSGGRLVKLGEGIEICEEQLRSVKWSDYRKLTRGLATILFSPMELATCSVTGQRWSRAGNGERPVKPALDKAKVQAIISYVATRFPMVEISRIKQVLAYKCKENSTAFKMKACRFFGDQQILPDTDQ